MVCSSKRRGNVAERWGGNRGRQTVESRDHDLSGTQQTSKSKLVYKCSRKEHALTGFGINPAFTKRGGARGT